MPITRKPKAPSSSVDIDALINRGGSIASTSPEEAMAPSKQNAVVNLRIPHPLLERIDQALETRPLKTPRHTWILEALVEKLDREGAKPE